MTNEGTHDDHHIAPATAQDDDVTGHAGTHIAPAPTVADTHIAPAAEHHDDDEDVEGHRKI